MRVSKILYHNICYMPIAKHLRILTFSKIQACCLCLYWTWFYWTNIYQWYFYTYWNIHQEVFHTFTLSSMTQLNDGLLFHEIIHQTLKPRNELQRLDLAMRHRDEHKAVFLPLLQLETIQFNRYMLVNLYMPSIAWDIVTYYIINDINTTIGIQVKNIAWNHKT